MNSVKIKVPEHNSGVLNGFTHNNFIFPKEALDKLEQSKSSFSGVNAYYSEEAYDLFNRFEKDDRVLNNFDFMDKVIQVSKYLHLTKALHMTAESYSPTVEASEFAKDTLNLMNGGPRVMDVLTWVRHVNLSGMYNDVGREKIEKAPIFKRPPPKNSLYNILRSEEGCKELLLTLYLVYGSDHQHGVDSVYNMST